jgi:hypothetical protein
MEFRQPARRISAVSIEAAAEVIVNSVPLFYGGARGALLFDRVVWP